MTLVVPKVVAGEKMFTEMLKQLNWFPNVINSWYFLSMWNDRLTIIWHHVIWVWIRSIDAFKRQHRPSNSWLDLHHWRTDQTSTTDWVHLRQTCPAPGPTCSFWACTVWHWFATWCMPVALLQAICLLKESGSWLCNILFWASCTHAALAFVRPVVLFWPQGCSGYTQPIHIYI